MSTPEITQITALNPETQSITMNPSLPTPNYNHQAEIMPEKPSQVLKELQIMEKVRDIDLRQGKTLNLERTESRGCFGIHQGTGSFEKLCILSEAEWTFSLLHHCGWQVSRLLLQ